MEIGIMLNKLRSKLEKEFKNLPIQIGIDANPVILPDKTLAIGVTLTDKSNEEGKFALVYYDIAKLTEDLETGDLENKNIEIRIK